MLIADLPSLPSPIPFHTVWYRGMVSCLLVVLFRLPLFRSQGSLPGAVPTGEVEIKMLVLVLCHEGFVKPAEATSADKVLQFLFSLGFMSPPERSTLRHVTGVAVTGGWCWMPPGTCLLSSCLVASKKLLVVGAERTERQCVYGKSLWRKLTLARLCWFLLAL